MLPQTSQEPSPKLSAGPAAEVVHPSVTAYSFRGADNLSGLLLPCALSCQIHLVRFPAALQSTALRRFSYKSYLKCLHHVRKECGTADMRALPSALRRSQGLTCADFSS